MEYICSRCNIKRPEKDFYWTGKYIRKYCKYCEHKAKVERTRQRKLKAVEILGGKCIVCEYDKCVYALELNHLYDKKFEPAAMFHTASWETCLVEIKKCELLCANCHREKTFAQYI